jgi:hypothetical protein
MAIFSEKKDAETGNGEKYPEPDVTAGYIGDEGAVHKDEFTAGNSTYAKLQRFAGKLGVEQRGIERVPSDERTDASMSKIGTLVSLTRKTLIHWDKEILIGKLVDLGQYGGLVVRYWRFGESCVWPWLCRHGSDNHLHQLPWYPPRVLLLNLWAEIWPPADGAVSILLWLLWRQDQ